MSNSNIEDYKCHEYIVKSVKEILTDSYSYSYALVLFDILKIDAFDEIFVELISNYELSYSNLNHFNKLSDKCIKSNNIIDNKELKKCIKKMRKPFIKDRNSKVKRLNDLVKLFTKMAIGFEFVHPVEMKEKENGIFTSKSLINTNFQEPKIKTNNIKGIDVKSTADKIEEKTKSLVNRVHNGIKGTIPSDNFCNNLISILTKSNFKIEKHYKGRLKDILKVIEVIVNKNMNYNVFDSLNSENKFYLDTEHIIPRSSNDEENNDKDEIWKLGNASLLERYINRPMGDPNFNCKQYGCYNKNSNDKECNEKTRKKGKREICYRDSSIRMTSDLLKYKKFTDVEINDRTEELADLIVKIVFSDEFDKDCNDKNHNKS
ncbi:GmrSD restriction endonuclease domain-containing protein [Lactobacillaceae bacterium Melli_B3]